MISIPAGSKFASCLSLQLIRDSLDNLLRHISPSKFGRLDPTQTATEVDGYEFKWGNILCIERPVDPRARQHTTCRAIKSRRIALVASLTYSLTNFRFELLKAMIAAGHEVTAFAPERDEDIISRLAGIGVNFVPIPMQRTGQNPFQDLRTLWFLYREFKRLNPDIVLSYTMKPVIYAGIAARMAGVPVQYALMTGLGYLFSKSDPSIKKNIIRALSISLYRVGLRKAAKVFVYNPNDQSDIVRYRMVADETVLVPINGSGVDLDRFVASSPPTVPLTFLLIARLLGEKGVREFVSAASHIRSQRSDIKFQILGPLDPNPSGIKRGEIDQWERDGIVTYLGETRDVRPYLANCSVFVLPTYYREGIPRTILEALSTGRAVITTNLPGCSMTVVDGSNGYLVKPRNVPALAKAMEAFVSDRTRITEMGKRSLALAQTRFDVHKINRQLLTEMNLI